jgi:cation diffusion facilitator family transporter
MTLMQRKVLVAWLSVFSNTTMVLIKLAVGLLIGSVSVISEAIHSGVDLVAAVIALVAVKISGKPADEEHPFGHGKVENLSGAIEAVLIFAAAGWIIWEAVEKLSHAQPAQEQNWHWGVLVMGVSAVANLLVSHQLFKIGREAESVALQADAWHLRTDVWTSVGVMAGLALIWAGGWLWPGADLRWIDPVAALGVALLILQAAWNLTLQAGRDLLDVRLATDELQRIRETILRWQPTVSGFHDLRTRKAGGTRFIDVHILVPGKMTVRDSHQIAMDITKRLRDELGGATVTIHVEPCEGNCTEKCLAGCLADEARRAELRAATNAESAPPA